MHCENCFCIYWDKDECTLEEVSHNIRGGCEDCIYIMIDEEHMKIARERILEYYRKIDRLDE